MPPDDEFVLEAPATAVAAPVVRAMAAAVAMAHDAGLAEITDIRLAVDEACSLLLPLAAPDTTVCRSVRIVDGGVDVTVRVTSVADALPDTVDLAILRALAAEVETRVEPGTRQLLIRLRMTA